MATTTGWTWDYVEHHLCLHRHAALVRQWRRSPPLQAMVQAWLGIEPDDPPGPTASQSRPLSADDEDRAIAEFARSFAAAGGLIH